MTKFYRQKHPYETTQIDDEWIILDTEHYTITKVNEIGGFCWSLLIEDQTVDTLLQEIKNKYETSTSLLDVQDYLNQLIQCGLVEHAG